MEYKKLFPSSEMNILLSYGTRSPDYIDMLVTNRYMSNSIICDSGAFSLNFADEQTTSKITLDGFIAFCRQPLIRKSFDFIFNYDENFNIDGFETNLRNMKKLEENGIQVVPIVHDYLGDHFDEIGYFLEKKYPIIALGYSEHKQKDRDKNLPYAVNRIVNSGAKVHLLGISSYRDLADIPVHYCDSSSWAQESQFGSVIWWNPHIKGNNKTDRVTFLDKDNSHVKHKRHIGNYQYLDAFQEYLKDQFNLTLIDLCGNNKDFNRQLVSVHFFVQLQDKIREIHKQKGFKID